MLCGILFLFLGLSLGVGYGRRQGQIWHPIGMRKSVRAWVAKQFNIRHVRIFVAVARCGSFKSVAGDFRLSQAAIAQAVGRLELKLGERLFERSATGLLLSEAGQILYHRSIRALTHLDPALERAGVRLRNCATTPQLAAVSALVDAESFTLAAKRLNLSHSTIHRAVAELEDVADEPLFNRVGIKIEATRFSVELARTYKLAFGELEQAKVEIGSLRAQVTGRLCIAISSQFPQALVVKALRALRRDGDDYAIDFVDVPPDGVVKQLTNGHVDVALSCLQDHGPPPELRILASGQRKLKIAWRIDENAASERLFDAMANRPWALPEESTADFETTKLWFAAAGLPMPQCRVVTTNTELLKALVMNGEFAVVLPTEEFSGVNDVRYVPIDGCVSLHVLIARRDWQPSSAQKRIIELLSMAFDSDFDAIAAAP